MSLSLFHSLLLTLIGLANGLVSAISGGGGGLFVLPIMVATFTDPHNVLIGSVFVAYLVSSLSGLIAYARKGLVDYRNGVILAIPTVPGVIIGTFLETSISDFEFKFGLGLITVVLSLTMYLTQSRTRGADTIVIPRKQSDGRSERDVSNDYQNTRVLTDKSGRTFTYSPKLLVGMLVNFAAGLISGTFGAGAAIIIVPAMIMLVRIPGHVAIASSRIVLFALNIGAVTTHVSTGAINYFYALALSLGAIVGIYFGARIVFKMSPTLLTKIMVVIFVMIGAYLILSSL